MERFVARPSRSRLALMLGAALVFVPLSLWVAGAFGEPPRPGREWIGWLGALLFGLLAALGIIRLRDSSDQIVIDDAGLTWRQWSDEHIPWEAVSGIDERGIRGQIFFGVHLHDVSAHPPTRMMGRIAASTSGMGFGAFSLSAAGTDRSADELREALLCFQPGASGREG